MAEKFFSIFVMGKEPSQAEEGELNKLTGLPMGPTTKIRVQVGGVAIPNFLRVWAKKILVKDKYEGKLEFTKWGATGGESVQLRYIPGCPTLDKVYQKQVMKLELSTEEQNMYSYINLDIGVNDFDLDVADPMYIEMLKHHSYNEDNISRNPRADRKYKLYDANAINKDKINALKKRKEAEDLVLSAEHDPEICNILAEMFNIEGRKQHEIIFKQLLEMLEDDPNDILEVLVNKRQRFLHVLKVAEDAHKIEFTSDMRLIANIDGELNLVYSFDTKNWKAFLEENIMHPDCWKVFQRVEEINELLIKELN